MKIEILILVIIALIGCVLARATLPLDVVGNERKIDVKARGLVANDEETKTLLAWLNHINSESSSPEVDTRDRGRAIDTGAKEDAYVKKDGFLVAKSPSKVPTLLRKCEGFEYVLKNLRNVRLACQPGYCLLVGGKEPNEIKIYAIIETATLQCVDKSKEYYITVKNAKGF